MVGAGELLADADGLAEGDVVVGDGVGLTDLLGCGLPAGVGEAEGECWGGVAWPDAAGVIPPVGETGRMKWGTVSAAATITAAPPVAMAA